MAAQDPLAAQDLDVKIAVEQLRGQLWARLNVPDYWPPLLPAVAAQVLALSMREDVDVRELLQVLERDAMLAARVLRVAQSPFYARAVTPRSLKQAVVILGLTAVRNLIAEAVVGSQLFRTQGYRVPMEQVLQHCRATAYLAHAICQRIRLDPDYAFLCGLFHDIGFAMALQVLDERGEEPGDSAPVVWRALNAVHCDAAALLIRQWHLPARLEPVVRHHHDLLCDEGTRPLACAVRLADRLAWGIEQGPDGGREGETTFDERHPPLDVVAEMLALGPQELESIREQSVALLRELPA